MSVTKQTFAVIHVCLKVNLILVIFIHTVFVTLNVGSRSFKFIKFIIVKRIYGELFVAFVHNSIRK